MSHLYSVGLSMMTSMMLCVLLWSSVLAVTEEEDRLNRYIQEMHSDGCSLIDSLFQRAYNSILEKEDIMTIVWFDRSHEFERFRYLLSDASIILEFDHNVSNPLPEKLAAAICNTSVRLLADMFNFDEISKEQVDDFYRFSYIMCKATGTEHCTRKIRQIKNMYSKEMLMLKLKKIIQKEEKKDKVHKLVDTILLGAR